MAQTSVSQRTDEASEQAQNFKANQGEKMAKGMILAAGQGTRVRPLTRDLPKPMVPILGKPVMEYLIEHLALHGITEIMVNVAYHYQKIEDYFGDGSRWGVEIGYSYEGVCDHGDILPRPMGLWWLLRHNHTGVVRGCID
jgi:mannose-1-phosphate guanylyltransferase